MILAFGLRPARAVLAHSGRRLSATWRTPEGRGSLPGIGAADDVPVTRGLMVCRDAEDRFERGVPVEAAIVAEDELVEIRVEVPAAQAARMARTPPLDHREASV